MGDAEGTVQRELRLKLAALQTTLRRWQFPINVNRSAICAEKRVFWQLLKTCSSFFTSESLAQRDERRKVFFGKC